MTLIDLEPHACILKSNNFTCNIIKKDYNTRRCFTPHSIILLQIPKWKCLVHSVYFNFLEYLKCLSPLLLEDIYCFLDSSLEYLLVFDRTIITWELYQLIVIQYSNLHNFNLILTSLKSTWNIYLFSFLHKVLYILYNINYIE